MYTMPAVQTIQHQESPPQPDRRACEPQPGGPILVVEDDALIREIVCEVLEGAGYEVVSATGGYDGLLKLSGIHPALVLLDMRMPDLDGDAFADTMKVSHAHVPIVAMTAASDLKSWVASIQAQAYIAKPFDVDDLLAVVGRFAS